jgi:hypothetical protein
MEDVFIGSEALVGGVLTRAQLRWNYRAMFPGVHISGEDMPSLSQRAVGAWLWSGRRAVIAGRAAAALHGARWIDEPADVEMIGRNSRPPRPKATNRIRRDNRRRRRARHDTRADSV